MSAIREEGNDEPIKVLFTLHYDMNLLDFAGPLEVLSTALFDNNDEGQQFWLKRVCSTITDMA